MRGKEQGRQGNSSDIFSAVSLSIEFDATSPWASSGNSNHTVSLCVCTIHVCAHGMGVGED